MTGAYSHEEMIHLYADGELPFEQHSALFAHLAGSEDARRLLESVMQFRRLSRQETFAVTPAMDAAFMQRLAQQRRGRPRPQRPPTRPTTLWQRRARVSLRTAALAGIGFLLIGFLGARPRAADTPAPLRPAMQYVQEPPVVMSAQYVFSPGVVVEAER